MSTEFDKEHEATYLMYSKLASIPMNELSFPDMMLLTGHNSCCGERLRRERELVKRSLALAAFVD
jgi:hypothetical protein